ncbi:DNA-3-methyladenine glycosylase I [Vagococcus vulneris]|uniref:DNA-3-methyladenine glycosylase n=1 Tax=Vagococcus vulneris TaxID=1977869 RepID=A0A429ZUE6_9ENTE|nr:DNA-3-methyladenine glycosylase I [Vagococcus vulneris]RST97357.1 DNA-3-methyladenine glycosylase [Vagococcus vulneris]
MGTRCDWAENNLSEQHYHDTEWGRPVHDDTILFEYLILESMQAGLSWSTILKKRETLTKAYSHWDYQKISDYNEQDVTRLLNNPGVIRHKLKIKSAITNAQAFMIVQREFSSFDSYLWGFVNNQPIINHWQSITEVPSRTDLSDEISKDLKKRGFKFLGSTTVYAYLQATGIIDDHLDTCFIREKE